jgi:hypothetical protein
MRSFKGGGDIRSPPPSSACVVSGFSRTVRSVRLQRWFGVTNFDRIRDLGRFFLWASMTSNNVDELGLVGCAQGGRATPGFLPARSIAIVGNLLAMHFLTIFNDHDAACELPVDLLDKEASTIVRAELVNPCQNGLQSGRVGVTQDRSVVRHVSSQFRWLTFAQMRRERKPSRTNDLPSVSQPRQPTPRCRGLKTCTTNIGHYCQSRYSQRGCASDLRAWKSGSASLVTASLCPASRGEPSRLGKLDSLSRLPGGQDGKGGCASDLEHGRVGPPRWSQRLFAPLRGASRVLTGENLTHYHDFWAVKTASEAAPQTREHGRVGPPR